MIEIALYQPDIPPNVATILRTGACLGVAVHVIEPAGFTWSDKSLRRAGLDYLKSATVIRQPSFDAFRSIVGERRVVLLTTKSDFAFTLFQFRPDDILLFGRESSGVPQEVHRFADARLTIPLKENMRSLNVAVACAMVLGEALRQTGSFPSG